MTMTPDGANGSEAGSAAFVSRDVEIADVVRQKLIDVLTPGFTALFTPEEAEVAGAFVEDAVSDEEALDASTDVGGEWSGAGA